MFEIHVYAPAMCCYSYACVCPSWFAWTRTSTFMDGFQNNLAQAFSRMSTKATCKLHSCRSKVKVLQARQIVPEAIFIHITTCQSLVPERFKFAQTMMNRKYIHVCHLLLQVARIKLLTHMSTNPWLFSIL